MKKVRRKLKAKVKSNFVDKAFSYFAPVKAARRMRSRMAMEVFNSYTGASKSRRSTKEWNPRGNDADSDILYDLPTLRDRSRDLVRNNPLAAGAIKTKVTSVVGTGLRLQSRIDRDVLSLTDEQADEWEAKTEREWRLFWDSKDTDIARTLNGVDRSKQAYQQAKENGDVFILLPRATRLGCPYDLKLQIIEADRVTNNNSAADSDTLSGGIQRDNYGAPEKYFILQNHPGSITPNMKWDEVKAFGENTGLRNIIHLFNPTRPGQSRGVPDLAAVIEPLKQLGRYSEAEVDAAVISSFFTVFIETENGQGGLDFTNIGGETGAKSTDKDNKLGSGMMVDLAAGEKIHDSNPGRPNTAFDGFVMSVLRQVGVGLEMPFEILVKHFQSSYSAARGAILEFMKYVMSERRWLSDNFLKLVYEIWMFEAVANERIAAPGYLSDPAIKAAYLGCEFIGDAQGQIDESKAVKAAQQRVDGRFSTLAEETTKLTSGDWDKNHKQQVKEQKKQIKDGLMPDPADLIQEPAQAGAQE